MPPTATPLTLRLRVPPLALRNVIRGGRRSIAAIAGVAFSVVMVLLQLGFLEAVRITATDIYEQLDFDIALLSSNYDQFYAPGVFPLQRIREAGALDTVVDTYPFYSTFGLWRCPPYPTDSTASETSSSPDPLRRWILGDRLPRPVLRRELLVIGLDPDHHPFKPPIRDQIAAARDTLHSPGHVLLNTRSHVDFGWQARDRFDGWELGRHAVSVVGGFSLLRGFASDGAILCDDSNFVRLCEYPSRDVVNFGFLKVQPGTTADTVARLKTLLPADVIVLPREDLLVSERSHWIDQTSTGKLFSFGVLVAMIVATAVVYQVLSNDIRAHLSEYATLKAMGYSVRSLSRVVITQALIYMLMAYAVAVLIGYIVYRTTESLAGIPMRLTFTNLSIAFALSVAVGLITGGSSLQRLRAVDPAELF